jgi:hypothetical protein
MRWLGGIFAHEDREEVTALELAIERLNSGQNLRGIELRPLIKMINHTDILDTKEKGTNRFGLRMHSKQGL